MKFKGKVAVWYYLVILAVNLLLIKGIFSPGGNSGDGFFAQMSTLIALLVCNGLMIPIAVRNDVVLEKERLVIHFGFMTQRIPYREITKIKRTHNPLSSMAASLDRIDTVSYTHLGCHENRGSAQPDGVFRPPYPL